MKRNQTQAEILMPHPVAPDKPYVLSLALQTLLICVPVFMAAIALSVWTTELADIIFTSIADAYLQVSTFVAATFLIFYSIEKTLKIDATEMLRRDTVWQVPAAAGLGALPGCGGAIIVITQYVTGRLSFGSVVAVLTATMGDAAFLLIAQEPLTGLAIMAMGFVVGTISGWIVNHIHGTGFMRQKGSVGEFDEPQHYDASSNWLDRMWYLILIPGVVLAGLVAFQVDVDAMFASSFHQKPATLIGVVGGTLALAMRLAPYFGMAGDVGFSKSGGMLRRTVADTNFVTVWVIAAYLLFELTIYFTGVDLQALFDGWALFTPLVAIIIGFLPGCGPQVLVTTMYLAGYVPLSAQIGNAISNDGDALFPAIAIAPRVAVVATLYSAVPALIISYGWFFIME
ncbi:putative manganese transporter [Candidatus Puniceispirillum marinum]|uniref:Uncharacterized protein n=1 Tax=Puniceispirillum marinum (strain IMCC1322) TaxID=488538 RepID=D5BT12_PUNMI|nr:putative manganese transporter [Candidatus Puniceispirillum marinum]ADE39409.1 hypothetical protein SAR116_1166 [Candidatus Puniceispirillum marinum IMCC1322]